MIAAKLINDIRGEVADPDKDRWSDARLLVLLSQAQVELALETRVLISRKTIPVIVGKAEYSIDENTELVLRVHNENGPVELLSHFEMDDEKPQWEFETGPTVQKVIYDLLSPNKLILYPIPSLATDAEQYTFEAGNGSSFVGGELLGVVTSIDNYSFNSPFGVVANLIQPGVEEFFDSPFGVVTSISESTSKLTVQYARRPKELTSVNSELELSESFREALLHLTVFRALTADIDARANALADKHYKLYSMQLTRLKNNKAHNQVKGNNARLVTRNPYAS